MAHDDTPVPKTAELFEGGANGWGLRGDPHVWQALHDTLAGTDLPASADAVARLLYTTFDELVEVDLLGEQAPYVYRERYAHGGMSSGMVHLGTWRRKLLPLLVERAERLLAARSRPVR
ncbi:hypothetical protein AB0469_22095 [Streptomyces sp. NPDC093801]|uniref:hypothetical protein n=1 Tax=Streptomyces sp. NPDC093801 TaxID=3155203 RepID=UPI00344EBF4B